MAGTVHDVENKTLLTQVRQEAADAAQDKRRKSLTEVLYRQIDILEREQKKIASGYEGSNNPKAARSENLAFAKQITETANAIISIKRRNTK